MKMGNTVVVLPKDRKGSMHVKLMPFLEEIDIIDRLNFADDIIQQFEDNNDLHCLRECFAVPQRYIPAP